MNALLNYEFKLDETSIEEFDLEYSIEVAKENIESYLDNITVNYFKKYSYKDIGLSQVFVGVFYSSLFIK
ncbi:hypothetical protein ACTNDN_24290 [Niallia sp. HCP3S3_B10]|uniref:Uncharacterized protein n=2 Tax=Bacillaceae TaxID=186817 RepID=A0ABV1F9Q6_9BACI|nr:MULTISPECIES: hypothetical protein [Bacillaceae]MCM3362343.1 hypothetical protein [Niallia sp. MER TA 168]CAI9386340.1 hypothetical protein BACSP_04541 [Bacillus sp. T2.9-1]